MAIDKENIDFASNKRLYAAILVQAIRDSISKEVLLKETARRWLFVQNGTDYVVSFNDCCLAINLDPETTRNGIADFIRKPTIENYIITKRFFMVKED